MPPRAQRLYPRMRERPPEFRVNPAWPWYEHLVLAFLGPVPGGTLPQDSSRFLQNGYNVGGTFTWNSTLSRYVFVTTGSEYAGFPRAMSVMTPRWMWCVYHAPRNYSSGYGAVCSFNEFAGSNRTDRNIGISSYGIPFAYHYASLEKYAYGPRSVGIGELVAIAGGYNGSTLWCAVNGVLGEEVATGWPHMEYPAVELNVGRVRAGYQNGAFVDALFFTESNVFVSAELADPANVDLRIGGIPLILPPRRRLWPVAPVAEYIKRRQLGLRVGSREAVT